MERLVEQRRADRGAAQHQCRAGAVGDVAVAAEAALVRVGEQADHDALAARPDEAAGLLQPAVRIEQLRPDRGDGGVLVERRDQPVDRARQHLCVVVQQQHVFAAAGGEGGVAVAHEADIALLPQRGSGSRTPASRAIAGSVEASSASTTSNGSDGGRRGDRQQATDGVREFVVGRHQDREARRGARRESARCAPAPRAVLGEPHRRRHRHHGVLALLLRVVEQAAHRGEIAGQAPPHRPETLPPPHGVGGRRAPGGSACRSAGTCRPSRRPLVR